MTGASRPQKMRDNLIVPHQENGLKIISAAMFSEDNSANILRGPMAANFLRQLLLQVDWEELDYLIIDYPPGTGDIQLSLSQFCEITAAFLVTTPQEVSLLDVKKCLTMFNTLQIPVLGFIENMSFFHCMSCKAEQKIFKGRASEFLEEKLGLPLLAKIPLSADFSESFDLSKPLVCNDQNHPVTLAFEQASYSFLKELTRFKSQKTTALSSFTLNWRSS